MRFMLTTVHLVESSHQIFKICRLLHWFSMGNSLILLQLFFPRMYRYDRHELNEDLSQDWPGNETTVLKLLGLSTIFKDMGALLSLLAGAYYTIAYFNRIRYGSSTRSIIGIIGNSYLGEKQMQFKFDKSLSGAHTASPAKRSYQGSSVRLFPNKPALREILSGSPKILFAATCSTGMR